MFIKESKWIGDLIKDRVKNEFVLDVGASSEEYRKRKQQYIGQLYDLITTKGGKIVTLDMDPETNPEILANLSSNDFLTKVNNEYGIVLANNILEHVVDVDVAIHNLINVVRRGGVLVVTVPQKLGIHFSPIDNGLRLTAVELVTMFEKYMKVIKAESWVDEHYREPFISDINFPKPEVSGAMFEKL